MRIEFRLADLAAGSEVLEQAFKPIAGRFGMRWQLARGARKRLGVFVSRAEHALLELLWQQRAGDLAAEISVVVSNHDNNRSLVTGQGIPFFHVPVTPDTKPHAEAEALRLLAEHAVDTIVLARYMQVLSADFLSRYPGRIINIHHGFLPAFVGANPYQAAYDRGVKLIGATAHYVTEDLDAGPIIEQDVLRIDHRHDTEDLRRLGRYIEHAPVGRRSWPAPSTGTSKIACCYTATKRSSSPETPAARISLSLVCFSFARGVPFPPPGCAPSGLPPPPPPRPPRFQPPSGGGSLASILPLWAGAVQTPSWVFCCLPLFVGVSPPSLFPTPPVSPLTEGGAAMRAAGT